MNSAAGPVPDFFPLYERMNEVSADMVEAAQAQDWDRLVNLAGQLAALRDELSANAAAHQTLAGLGAEPSVESERARVLIQQILDHDAAVLRLVAPWMAQVRQFLGTQSRRREVQHAYTTADFG